LLCGDPKTIIHSVWGMKRKIRKQWKVQLTLTCKWMQVVYQNILPSNLWTGISLQIQQQQPKSHTLVLIGMWSENKIVLRTRHSHQMERRGIRRQGGDMYLSKWCAPKCCASRVCWQTDTNRHDKCPEYGNPSTLLKLSGRWLCYQHAV